MKKNKMLFVTTLFCGLIFFTSITVSYADDDTNTNLIEWFHNQVDQMVNNSINKIQVSLNAKEEELQKQLATEKQKSEEDLQTYKEEQLKLYNQQLNEIKSAKQASINETSSTPVNGQRINSGQ